MRRCSSAPTWSRPAGRRCSRSWMPGRASGRRIFRTTSPAAPVLPRPTSCWPATGEPGARSADPAEFCMAPTRKISLVLADVDGTLVTEDKILTPRAQAAVRRLGEAGVQFAITSGRPPRGMAMLFEPLQLTTPIAGFNGGLFVKRDLSIIEQKTLPADVAAKAIELIRGHGLDAWVYRGNDWLITKAGAPHVDREAWTVKFQPTVVADFTDQLDDAAKIVGI